MQKEPDRVNTTNCFIKRAKFLLLACVCGFAQCVEDVEPEHVDSVTYAEALRPRHLAMNSEPETVGGFRTLNNRQESRGGSARRIEFTHTYQDIISVGNLLDAWCDFVRGKSKRKDVQEFGKCLMNNILDLHEDLKHKTYTHGSYSHFRISDPKPRDIHKASVRDRLVHHALYRQFYPFFDRTFISDSYSCRVGKGTHKAMNRFRAFAHQVSRNTTRTCWVLKCDIKKFFASIDQLILMNILRSYIPDLDTLWLLNRVVESFSSTQKGKGLPLGNLTSQLLVNIYMNEFDQFMKHSLKATHYLRYADDFVLLSLDRNLLLEVLPSMIVFLRDRLKLKLHPKKLSIATLASGIDFLGWVHFPDHRVLRTSTKKRMLKTLQRDPSEAAVVSYRGMLWHGNAHQLQRETELPILSL